MVSFCAAESSLCAKAGGMIFASVAKIRADDGALFGIAGNDWRNAVAVGFQRLIAKVQPHPGHARTLVRSVTAEAGFGHDRPDVAVETNLRVPSAPSKGRQPTVPILRAFGFNNTSARQGHDGRPGFVRRELLCQVFLANGEAADALSGGFEDRVADGGRNPGVLASPTPPEAFWLLTMCTSTTGISSMRSTSY